MEGSIFILAIAILFFLFMGVKFTFFTEQVREYYFKMYRNGIEKYGFLTAWIDKYPNVWFFRLFGVLYLLVVILLVIILIRKLVP